ncbi:alpha/beta fold hydrolase [Lysobacter silvisoli]|uniref:Alpha/beta hydrolase n=1 Tax=Lysobacter silvisoli TaxID=2293254 RepID=A0A371JXV5_9GAMM|nr:alpha/beta hydrolase [Lysobacter silvisoli]RDZ26498.1 alpha/beta hydrolase [Lysobacter silvisoli]
MGYPTAPKWIASWLLALALPCTAYAADPDQDAAKNAPKDPYSDARAIVADLQRIVTPNGVQETFKAPIGGIDQWVSVRGKDRAHPLLLFVHGGPASPSMPVAWTFQRPWEDYYTVVNWDQRGAGKTYLANPPDQVAPTIRIDRYVDDTIDLIELLGKRYGKRKVVLVGHSWGSIVALKAALKRPDLIHAYVGIGQVISVPENERLSYEYALRMAREHNNQEAIRDLQALAPYPGPEPLTRERIIRERNWAQLYSGLTAYRTQSDYYYDAPKLSPEYTAADRAAIDQGNQLTLGRILQEWSRVDFTPVRNVPFPVFMHMGRYDQTTPSAPTARWITAVKAPVKRGIWFEHSAHLSPMEEPGRTLVSLVEDVLPVVKGDAADTKAGNR